MARMGSSKAGRRVRRQFTEEFKAGAVRLVLDEERTVGAVARELDLTPSALAGWVRAGQAERTQGKSGLMKEDREELVRLRKELRIVQEGRCSIQLSYWRGRCARSNLSLAHGGGDSGGDDGVAGWNDAERGHSGGGAGLRQDLL